MPCRFRVVLISTALLVGALPAYAQRLPTTVVPVHYDLAFDVDLNAARFTGTETIRVRLTEPLRRVVLHALDIQFHRVTITAAGITQRATVTPNLPTQTAALVTAREIPQGDAQIHIEYSGVLNNQLRGFYLSKANGRNYAVTQLEATDARRAFPSFDEPAYKATFSVAITVDERDTAISNGRLLSDRPGPGAARHTLTFAESPRMSTYLVAIAVGDFQCLEDSAEGIPIRVCATPDKTNLGHLALGAAKQILAFYNRYYSIKYPFGKLDMVAVPDFAAGAMENTAAIFYREVDLLTDQNTASVTTVKRIWEVLAHEMAHQWFGDLVTMRWWDDLWLNEGFASWMEKQPLADAKPEWHMDVDAALETQTAMTLDSLATTRAIHAAVETPAQIEESFDAIAYQKGAAVMRMIEGYLGPDRFRRGVNAYLEKHQFGNATSEDFWTAMTAASGAPVDRILPTFVNQPGVPLLLAASSCNGDVTTLTLEQQRFSESAPASRSATRPTWTIPICPVSPPRTSAPATCVTAGASEGVEVANRCAPWVFVNGGAQGYFRTAYSPQALRAMGPDIGTQLTAPERLSLVGDEWALVRAGRHTVAEYLTLAAGFGSEHVSGVLTQAVRPFSFIAAHLTTPATRASFERFVQSLLRPLFNELKENATGDDDERALRAIVLATLGGVGNDREASTRAREALDRALAGQEALDPTTADAVVDVAAKHGDAPLFEALLDASRRSTSPTDRYRYLYALAQFEDPALVQRGLELALSPELRAQDTSLYLARYLRNRSTHARAWAFVKAHWDVLAPKIDISFGLTNFVQSLQSFCDAGSREDIRSFFTTHELPAASRTIDQTLEQISRCIAVKERQTPALAQWLASRP